MAYIISRPLGGACGIGHQFCTWLPAWLLSHKYGLKFVHAPFCGDVVAVHGGYPTRVWENFLNFGYSEITEKELPKDIERIHIPKIPWELDSWYDTTVDHPGFKDIILKYKDRDVLLECAKDQFIAMDWESLNIQKLRNRYWMARKENPIKSDFHHRDINVVIHIRRADVTEHGRYKVRWVGNDVYQHIIDQIKEFFVNEPLQFHIFSDAKSPDEFSSIIGNGNIKFSLWGSDSLISFHHMAMADILVTGQSSFSSLAGHMSTKIKLVRPWSPFWDNFPKQQSFIEVEQDGSFNKEML